VPEKKWISVVVTTAMDLKMIGRANEKKKSPREEAFGENKEILQPTFIFKTAAVLAVQRNFVRICHLVASLLKSTVRLP
jgi:hypothetical protein